MYHSDIERCKFPPHNNRDDGQSCVLAGVCMVIGVFICFFGYRAFKFVLFLSGFLVGFFFTSMWCSGNLTDVLSGKEFVHRDQIFLGTSVGVGIFAGLLTLCHFFVGLFVLGAAMGWSIGMFFLPLLYKHAEFLSEHNWVPYPILCAFAIAGGILILCFQKLIIVISTSFLGAFSCITGYDYLLENHPVYYYSVNILRGYYSKYDLPHCWYTWIVPFAFIPIMFAAGVVVQLRLTGQGSDHRQAYDRRSLVPCMANSTPVQEFSDQRPMLADHESTVDDERYL